MTGRRANRLDPINAPNFMIETSAKNRDVAMPSFFACSFDAVVLLAPMLVVVRSTLLWRRASRPR